MWKYVWVLWVGASTAQVLDDFADNQAMLSEPSNVSGAVDSWVMLAVPDGLAAFRRLAVDGGVNGNPGTTTSAAVAGGALTAAFELDGSVSNQSVVVAWSDQQNIALWQGALDVSAYDALVLDMGLVTQPINVALNVRDKGSTVQETQVITIDTFGLHVFDLLAFQNIDLSNLDLITLRIVRAPAATNDIVANFNEIYFFTADVIFASDFDPLD